MNFNKTHIPMQILYEERLLNVVHPQKEEIEAENRGKMARKDDKVFLTILRSTFECISCFAASVVTVNWEMV